jgi:hypothetical protein
MVVSPAAVLYAMSALPVCWADRDDPRKPEQLQNIAAAIAHASPSPRRAVLLIVISYHESRWCLHVHSGQHRGPGRGLFQMEGQEKRYPGPFVGLSPEETGNAAWVASQIVGRSGQCGRAVADVLTAYAGRRCGTTWPTLAERVRTYRFVSARLHRALRETT